MPNKERMIQVEPVSRIASRFPISLDLGLSRVISAPQPPVMQIHTRKGMKLSFSLINATAHGSTMKTASIIRSHPTTLNNMRMLMYDLCR